MTLITSAAGAKPGVCSLMLASVLVFAFFHHAFRSPHTLKPGCYNLIYLSQRPGVIISDDLSFIKHYSSIVQKAYKTLGIIRKTFNTTSSLAKKVVFVTFCSHYLPVWSLYLTKDITFYELVQRRATKFTTNGYTSSYKSCLLSLHLLPLMYFFELNDIVSRQFN